MLMIRLQRTGRKHEPTFRLVLTDSKNSTKSGKYLEVLGSHDPRRPKETILNGERIVHLVGQGAQLSDTVHNMLITRKIIKGKKVNALPRRTPIKKEEEKQEAKGGAGPAAPATDAAVAPAEAPAQA